MPGGASLPAPATRFVGRVADLGAVADLLVRPDVRVLTLTGAAGVGKTRLAIEAMLRCQAASADAVHFVALADVRDPDLVASAVLSALGSVDIGAGDALARTVELVADTPTLLVLDNFEQVLQAATAVAVLVERCPSLTVLVTSRHPLQIRPEWCYHVAPLAVPDGSVTDTEAMAFDAVAFLASRLESLDQRIVRDAAVGDLVDVCRRLDGLPLALELVAARSRLLPLSVIRDGLERRLDLLGRGGQDMPSRQRTMREALVWSYELLEPTSRIVLRRMGVCVGGAGLETASELVADLGLSQVRFLDVLDELVAHSLVDRSADGRLRMLEVVREFVLDELVRTNEMDTAVNVHAEHFLRFAEQAATGLSGRDQLSWLDRLQDEAANLAAAVRASIARSDSERALRLCLASRFLWYVRGPLIEGQAFFAAALALPGASPQLRARAMVEAAALARHAGWLDGAQRLADDALAIARGVGDTELIATALLQVGFIGHLRGRYQQARDALEECLALRAQAGNALGVARALHHLGLVAYYGDGDSDLAWDIQVRCLELFRELENDRHVTTVLIAMAELARVRHQFDASHALLAEAFALINRLQDLPLLSYALYIAAATAADETHPSLAMRLLGAAEGAQHAFGAPPWPVVSASTERWLPGVISRFGHPRADTLRAAGSGLSMRQAIALALAPDEGQLHPLTSREREVAGLVASGLSNRAIAGRLVISERTVDGHITHILTKLGFTSRTQIAAWAITHLPPPP